MAPSILLSALENPEGITAKLRITFQRDDFDKVEVKGVKWLKRKYDLNGKEELFEELDDPEDIEEMTNDYIDNLAIYNLRDITLREGDTQEDVDGRSGELMNEFSVAELFEAIAHIVEHADETVEDKEDTKTETRTFRGLAQGRFSQSEVYSIVWDHNAGVF